ncbi:MAG: hypothetical protein LBJ04_20095 [Sphingobacterium sp.]|jgi:hypothetical protein|nr:hypothetical protein [Sphingobacterium sp.]
MWKHFIFLFTALLISFNNLNAKSLVLKSDSFKSQFLATKNTKPSLFSAPVNFQKQDNCNFTPIFPSVDSFAEMDVEISQEWLADSWLITVDLLWHELLPSMLQNDYRYQHTLDLEPIPIARFLLFEQIKIPF